MKYLNRVKWFIVSLFRSVRAYVRRKHPVEVKALPVVQIATPKTVMLDKHSLNALELARAKRARRCARNLALVAARGLNGRCA
jgi:hypothetical protein